MLYCCTKIHCSSSVSSRSSPQHHLCHSHGPHCHRKMFCHCSGLCRSARACARDTTLWSRLFRSSPSRPLSPRKAYSPRRIGSKAALRALPAPAMNCTRSTCPLPRAAVPRDKDALRIYQSKIRFPAFHRACPSQLGADFCRYRCIQSPSRLSKQDYFYQPPLARYSLPGEFLHNPHPSREFRRISSYN